jgi:hypothetical protein
LEKREALFVIYKPKGCGSLVYGVIQACTYFGGGFTDSIPSPEILKMSLKVHFFLIMVRTVSSSNDETNMYVNTIADLRIYVIMFC